MIILAPSQKDFELAKKTFCGTEEADIYLTGVGPKHILNFLSQMNLPLKQEVLLFGYARARNIKPGLHVWVDQSYWFNPFMDYDKEGIKVKRPGMAETPLLPVACYTSTDSEDAFLTSKSKAGPALYDSELSFLLSVHPNSSAWRVSI
ncbi:hypothetical protein IKG02_02605 [Candidatus Saccharibacteria bacterium]|nr:hypothetical protein [Candidatus Saccharibacteria bacterium]